MSRAVLFAAIILLIPVVGAAGDDDEITLFNGKGKAIAYIDMSDEMTIYMWNGKPASYLESDSDAKGFHIYGFNGKHLGWFVDGVARDHDGKAACAVKERMQSTEGEPFKSFKAFKPFKDFTQSAPSRPTFRNAFSVVTCSAFLMEGSK
jgi:hypothetical protein